MTLLYVIFVVMDFLEQIFIGYFFKFYLVLISYLSKIMSTPHHKNIRNSVFLVSCHEKLNYPSTFYKDSGNTPGDH